MSASLDFCGGSECVITYPSKCVTLVSLEEVIGENAAL